MSKNPEISVVMPAFNAERFIAQAIESILHQSFSDFEFIIVNDGSTDKTLEIINSYKDPRIVILENKGNKGLSYSFNRGIAASRGKYIARMDADDISSVDRFKKQFDYLENHPEVDILGSAMFGINESGKKLRTYYRDPTHLLIKFSSLFSTPLYHPTIMAKSEILKNFHYDENMSNSEDYELWSRLLFTTKTIFANIVEPLLYYRTYPSSFTQTINLDKRIASAHNTIQNLNHYVRLSERDKSIIIALRQERRVGIFSLLDNLSLYLFAGLNFCNKEKVSMREVWGITAKLSHHALFLTKHYIKHL